MMTEPSQKTLHDIVFETVFTVYHNYPKLHGSINSLFRKAFEKSLYNVAYQFSANNKKRLAGMLGQNVAKVRDKCRLYDVKNYGTRPRNVEWLNCYEKFNPIQGDPNTLEHLMSSLEHQVARWVCLFLLQSSLSKVHYLYDIVQEEIEKPLIILAFGVKEGSPKEACKLLGISPYTLRKKLDAYKLNGR